MIEIVLAAAIAVAQAPAAEPPKPAASPAAERRRPERAPRETVTALMPSDKKVTIEYGRPALGGRNMTDLLSQLPADRIWRAGVDQATTLTTDTDIIIGGKRVKAGKYTVYVHAPATGDYSLVLNTDPGVPLKTIFPAAPPEVADALWPRLGDYGKVTGTEVLRVPLRKAAAPTAMDRFLIGLAPARNGQSSITLTWGDQSWTTDIKAASVPVSSISDGDVPTLERVTSALGGRTVTIEYARPALKGRTMRGMLDMLQPDRIWRAGVHFPTTLTTDGDLVVGGRPVKAGKYTVFVHAPENEDYSLVLNGSPAVAEDYMRIAATEVLRVPMRRGEARQPLESFLIALSPAGPSASTLTMTWGDQSWNIDLRAASPSR